MTGHMSGEAPTGCPEEARAEPAARWALATLSDVLACDIDSHIPPEAAADWHSLGDIYRAAAERGDLDPGAARVCHMLGGLFSMMLEAKSPVAPFRAMLVLADGGRSAITEDFRPCVEALVAIATRSQHPTIISRAADVAWTLERRRHDMGLLALVAYCQLLDDVAAGSRRFKHEDQQEGGRLGVGVLRRCVVIARSRSFGDRAPDLAPLTQRVEAARRRALDAGEVVRHHDLAELALDYSLREPEVLAADIEATAAGLDGVKQGHLIVVALKAAARAYLGAKKAAQAHAIRERISDVYVAMADQMAHSAMIASRHLADAISVLAGVPDAKERRKELRHRLIDVQAGIADEMTSISHEIDLRDVRAQVAQHVDTLGFYDALFYFAMMRHSPDPTKAREDAAKSVQKYPLSSLFAASYHDREGKVRHASSGAGAFGVVDETRLGAQIAQQESLRRNIDVGVLEVPRGHIAENFYIDPDVLLPVLSQSPFVPPGQEHTFAQGLSNFLRGDAISALYILAPLVEAGVRACLKSAGHEVTTFDDASQTQEDKGLSALYRDHRADIEAVFGSALAFNVEQVFLHPAGPAIRHSIAHGLLHDGDPFSPDGFYACWLVLHICLAPLYRHRGALGLPDMASPSHDKD